MIEVISASIGTIYIYLNMEIKNKKYQGSHSIFLSECWSPKGEEGVLIEIKILSQREGEIKERELDPL